MNKKYVTGVSYDIVGCAIKVHKSLGVGLLESVYQECLRYELLQLNYSVKRQQKVPLIYDGKDLELDLRFDLLVNDCVVVEIKAIENLLPVHEAQVLTYMKLLEVPQGLLINFFSRNISKSTRPFVNEIFRALPDS
jgi:GxxExxY protein